MKLCITAAGSDLSAATDAAFGRAPWFVLIDTASGAAQGLENSNAQATQGAGIAAAQAMSEHGVDAVLTGRLGPKAKTALEASGIKMYEGLGNSTVAEALEQFRAGKFGDSGQNQTQTAAEPATPSAASTSTQGQGPNAVQGQGRGACNTNRGQGQGQGRGQGKGGCGAGRGQGRGRGR